MAPQKAPSTPDFIPDGPPAFIPDSPPTASTAAAPTSNHPVLDFINQAFANNPGEGQPGGYAEALRPVGNIGRRAVRTLAGGASSLADSLVPDDTQKAGEEQFNQSSAGRIMSGHPTPLPEDFANTLDTIVPGLPIGSRTKELIDTTRKAGPVQAATDLAGDAAALGIAGKLTKGAIDFSSPADATAINKLAFAAGKGTTGDITRALPDLHAAAKGVPATTVDDFLSTVNQAKSNLSNEAGAAMAPIAQKSTVPISISDKLRSLITPNLANTADGIAEANKIKAAALDFEKPWTYEALDAERNSINKKLNNFYKKGINDQYAATGNRNIAIDKTIADAIRDKLYPEMDAQAGQPTGYFRDLKQRHGALINLADTLDERVKDLKDQTARIKGGPRLTDEQAASGALGHTGVARTAIRAIHQPNPLAVANRRVGGAALGASSGAGVGSLPARYLLLMSQPDQQPALPAGHPLAASAPVQ